MAIEGGSNRDSFLDGLTASQSFVLTGTRGGRIRCQILEALERKPHTVEWLANELGETTETLRDHLDVLGNNDMVDSIERSDPTEFVLADDVLASRG